MQQSITDIAWDETNKYDSRVERKKYYELAVSNFKMLFELVEKAQKTLTEEVTNYKYELAIEQTRFVRETELSKLTHLFIAV